MSNRLTRDGTAADLSRETSFSGADEDRKSVIFSTFLAYTLLYIFPCSADRERDWLPPCKVVFSGGQSVQSMSRFTGPVVARPKRTGKQGKPVNRYTGENARTCTRRSDVSPQTSIWRVCVSPAVVVACNYSIISARVCNTAVHRRQLAVQLRQQCFKCTSRSALDWNSSKNMKCLSLFITRSIA